MESLLTEQHSNGTPVPGEREVLCRLTRHSNKESTPVLYDFGSLLLEQTNKITDVLDSKAQLSASFVGGIVALLISTFSYWKGLITEVTGGGIFIFLGLIMLMVAAGLAVLAFRVRIFEGIQEKDTWFAEDFLDFPDQLRRFYLIAMYRAVKSADQINLGKALYVRWSHYLLLAGLVVVLIPPLVEIWSLGAGPQLTAFLHFFVGWMS